MFYDQQKKIINYSKYKTDLFINDEFIDYILIFHEFQRKISEVKIQNLEAIKKTGNRKKIQELENHNIIEILQTWGDKYAINIKTLIDVLEIRDSIIFNLSMIGLNPYHLLNKSYANINNYTDQKKLEYVIKIKQCIFEGFKLNLAVWNANDKKYYLRKTHIPLNINSNYISSRNDINKFGDNNPKYIIVDKILYMLDNKTNVYTSTVSNISILDGFITIDPNFDTIIV